MKRLIPLTLCLISAFFSYAQPGEIDPTFGINGKLVDNFGFSRFEITCGAVQNDGKIIIGGNVDNGTNTIMNFDFFLTRFNADGTPDVSFGNNGIIHTDISPQDNLMKVVVLSNGKILAVGGRPTTFVVYNNNYMALYNANGQPDAGFGSGGILYSGTTMPGYFVNVEPQADGRILVGARFADNSSIATHMVFYWLNQDGTFYKTLSLQKFANTADYSVNSACLLPDGKILSAGLDYNTPFLSRHQANGKLDSTFGVNGRILKGPDYLGGNVLTLNADSTRFYTITAYKGPLVNHWYYDTVQLQRHFIDGTIDAGFGNNGVAELPHDSSRIIFQYYKGPPQFLIKPDNRITLGGITMNSLGVLQFSALNLLPNGTVDNGFGSNGVIPGAAGGTWHETAIILKQADGKSVIAGYEMVDGQTRIALMRVNTDGSADNTFMNGGVASRTVGTGGTVAEDFGKTVKVLPDGKILASSLSRNGPFVNLVLAKYNTNGSHDASFGKNGVAYVHVSDYRTLDVSPSYYYHSGNNPLGTDAQGNIYVLTPAFNIVKSITGVTVFKFTATGKRDSSFADFGRKDMFFSNTLSEQPLGLVVQPDDKPLIAAVRAEGFGNQFQPDDPSFVAIARLNTDGSYDPSFGVNGVVRENQFTGTDIPHNQMHRLVLQPDGKILLCGEVKWPYPRFGVRRYNANGTVDQQFNNGIMVATQVNPNGYNVPMAVALQADGKILVAGTSAPYGMVVARYTAAGYLDQTFGVNGVRSGLGGGVYECNMLVQPDGKILLMSDYYRDNGAFAQSKITLARVLTDGSVDPSFGYMGLKAIETSGLMLDIGGSMTLTPDGRILVCGTNDMESSTWNGHKHDFVIYGLQNTLINCSTITANAGRDTAICAGGTATLGAPAVPGYTYNWINGSGLSSTTVAQPTITTYSGGSFYLTVKDANGCTATDTVLLTVNSLPTQPVISPSGPFTVCQGGDMPLTTAATGSLQWLKDGVVIPAANGSMYKANATGQYSVQVTDNNTCSSTSRFVILNMVPLPATPSIIANGPLTFCQGGSVQLSTTATGSLQWLNFGIYIQGAKGSSYTATTTGQYSVQVTDANSCGSTSAKVDVGVGSGNPAAPVITQTGNTLQSSVATGSNQWYLNGAAIQGATGATYEANSPGVYTVKVTVNGCTSAASNAITIVTTGVNSPELDRRVVIAPNPVVDNLNIQYTGTVGRFSISVYNIFGVQVYGPGNFTNSFTLDMRSSPAGVYAVHIVNTLNGEKIHRLIMKQ